MKMRCLLFLGVGLLLAADAPKTDAFKKDEAIKQDKNQLQGTWSVINVISDGKEISSDKLIGAKVIFNGDKITGKVIRLGKDNECSYKIDPTPKLKVIDFIHADGAVMPGIYSLNERKLRWCTGPPKAARPTKMEAEKGSGLTLIILHKD